MDLNYLHNIYLHLSKSLLVQVIDHGSHGVVHSLSTRLYCNWFRHLAQSIAERKNSWSWRHILEGALLNLPALLCRLKQTLPCVLFAVLFSEQHVGSKNLPLSHFLTTFTLPKTFMLRLSVTPRLLKFHPEISRFCCRNSAEKVVESVPSCLTLKGWTSICKMSSATPTDLTEMAKKSAAYAAVDEHVKVLYE